MNDQQINIAIAEACGWMDIRRAGSCWGLPPKGFPRRLLKWGYINPKFAEIPDYCSDLNAMHEAWEGLDFDQKMEFSYELRQIVESEWNTRHEAFKSKFADEHPQTQLTEMANATARHRAEAFLRTLGKWRDE